MARQIAHEIKNPLGGIYGAAQILKEGSGNNEKFINIILKDANRLNDVIRRFLDFSSPFAPQKTRFDYNVEEFCFFVLEFLCASVYAMYMLFLYFDGLSILVWTLMWIYCCCILIW